MSNFNAENFFKGFDSLYAHYIEDRICFYTNIDTLASLFESNLLPKNIGDTKYMKLVAFCEAEAILVNTGCIENFADVQKAYEIFKKQVSDNSILDKLRKDFEKNYVMYENENADFDFNNENYCYTSLPINTSFYGYKMGYNQCIKNNKLSENLIEL